MLDGSRIRGPLVLILAAGLTSCATNTLRVDYARTVGTQGRATAEASREFLNRVDIARREANIELVAADPACHTEPAIVRRSPRVHANGDRGWLCVPRGWKPDPSYNFSLHPLTPQLEPTFDLIAALSSYAEALTEIVDTKPSDPLKPLLDALATARAVQGTLQAVRNRTGEPIPAADDPRVAAVSGFVGFLTELSDEADKVRRLRQVLAKHPEGARPLIQALREDLRGWNRIRAGDELLRSTIVEAIVQRTIDRRPPASVAERREALSSYYTLADAHRASAQVYPALTKVLDELESADRDLRRVLVETPNLNPKEKRKVAEMNRQRIVRALEGVTALITSFRGA